MRTAYNKKNIAEIDRLPRITLRNLKPLFSRAKELLSEDKDYFKGKDRWIGLSLSYRNKEIKVYYYPEELRLLLKWEHGGKEREQNVGLIRVESNLGLSPFLSFVCPYSGEVCRKLYTDWYIWIGRRGFHHTYSERRDSKRLRIYTQMGKAFRKVEKIKECSKYRKNHYKGEATQRWKRELRAEKKAHRLLSIWKEASDMRMLEMEAQLERLKGL